MKKKIICFAGLDGSGKTTQARMTNEWLNANGFPSEFVRFHTELTKAEKPEVVKRSTKYLIENKLMLSLSAIELLKEAFQIQMKIQKNIAPLIMIGKNIVFDRYIETYDAYTALTDKKENWVRTINQPLAQPDYYFFIDVLPEVSYGRILKTGRRISDHETVEQLEKARNYYLENKEKYSFIIIDGNQSVEDVHEEIKRHIINT